MNTSVKNTTRPAATAEMNLGIGLLPIMGGCRLHNAATGCATSRRKRFLSFFLGLAALILALPTASHAQSAGWLDSAWVYRSQVSVNNPNGTALADFQVRMVLDASFDYSKAKNAGADIRVTSADGVSLVPFWIEQWDSVHSTASIWAKLPSLPAAGTTLYVYYGNPAATTASDGNGTFEFFDDFEGTGSVTQGYFNLSAPQTAMLRDQDWESSPPHTLSVVQANSGGYTYWGYYGLVDCGGIGLAFSNDLNTWTKSATPLYTNGRWPSVLLVNGRYYMLYTKDYCTTSQIVLSESSDGINFTDVKTIVAPQNGVRNQNPNLFFNPNDGKYYIYWYRGDDLTFFEIHARSAATIEGLDDNSNETTFLTSNQTLAAPDMLYYNGTYFLSTEVKDPTGDWATQIYSSNSPLTGFVPLPGNPVLATGSACFFQHIFGNTLHGFICKDTANFWTLEHRTADLTAPRTQFQTPGTSKWSASGGTWMLKSGTQQDGTTGTVAEGSTFARQILSSTYSGTDYIVQAFGKQVGGNVWGLAARAQNANSYYSTNLYDNPGISTNLFAYSWVNDSGPGATATLGAAGVGQVNPNTWYKLTVKVHGAAIQVYKDDVLQIQSSDSSLATGGVALYGEAGTVADFNNVLVRKYAGSDPTASLTPGLGQVLTSLTINPTTVAGGNSAAGSVSLATGAPASGATITLSSSNPSLVNVPATLDLAAGDTGATFSVNTSAVQFPTLVTITATYQGAVQTANLTITPLLYSVDVTPSSVLGGTSAVGTVILAGPAPPDGISVNLSSNSGVAIVPANVTVPPGATSATFAVNTSSVTATTTATITASYNSATQAAAISVTPMLTSISFNPSKVLGGASSTGTVTLATIAPAGGVTLAISSGDPSVVVPGNVMVPAGASSATFAVSTGTVTGATIVPITASYNGASQTANLTVSNVGGLWLDSAWAYRSAVNLANPGGTALAAFQVQILLNNSFDFSRVRADGADLRVTDSDGLTPIPYWIESWNPTLQTASVWVRVPTIPTAGGTIYLYYGNSAANASTASGDATFEFFDDFSSGSLNTAKWTAFGGTWSTMTDAQPDGSSGGVVQATAQSRQVLVSSYTGTDYVAQTSARQLSGRALGFGVRATDVSNLYSINIYDDLNFTSNMYVYSWVNNPGGGATATLGSAALGNVNPNTWYKWAAKVHGSSVDIYKDDVLSLSVSDSSLATGGIAFYGEGGTIAEFDNTFVRKYTPTDPVASINGGTQQSSFTLTLTPSTLDGGANAQGTVFLSSPAPAGGVIVTLVSDNSSLATVPPSVTVAAGTSSAAFSVGTSAVATSTPVVLYATASGTTQSTTLTLNPPTLPALLSVSLNPSSVVGGSSTTGAIALSGPAPVGGAVVLLSSDNLAAQVPASVTVPANAATAVFTVTTNAVGNSTPTNISATYNGSVVSAGLAVNPASLSSLILSPTALVGGGTSTGIVMLSASAPSGGAVVTLSSNQASAQVPATVTVPANATTANFTVTTTAVGASTQATISGSYSGSSQNSVLTINPPGILSVAINPDSVVGGSSATGTVLLSAPAPTGGTLVGLTSSNPAAAQLPSSVTVPANATTATFAVSTSPVGAYASVTVTAAAGTSTQTGVFTVTPAPVLIESVILNPNDLVGGNGSVGTVTMSGPAPLGGALVPLSSSNPAVASVPSSVTVPEGSLTANFNVTTHSVTTTTIVTIFGTSENVTRNATLNVTPATSSLAAVTLNPTALVGGSSSTGTVTLTAPAPSSGAIVTLSSNNAAAQVPATVTVAANASTATFTVTTTSVATSTAVSISGNYNATQAAGLTVNPPTPVSLGLNPTSVAGGSSSTGTITLNAPAPAGGAVIALSSNNGSALVPASVTVAANATSATFTVTTTSVSSSVTATITGTYNGVGSSSNLTITAGGVSALSLNPTTVVGGISSTGTVTLTSAAPAGGAVVALSSNNAAAQVPATVTVAANATTATFTVTTTNVTSTSTATITATYNGSNKTASLSVTQRTVSALSMSPTSVVGGISSTGTVTLSSAAPAGGAVVTLSSNNSAAQVPATVTVAANATTATFTVTTSNVTSTQTATITATYNGSNRTATLSVTQRTVSALSMSPTSVVGGISSTGTVTLSSAAPAGGAVVTLSSNNSAAQVPANVTVAANATTATFTVTTSNVTSTQTATITATYNGSNRTATLSVTQRTVSALSMSPTSVVGGISSTGTVTLSSAAPAGGAVVTLSSNNSAAQVPANVTVAANATTATFTVTTTNVSSTQTATITATYNGTNRTATLSVTQRTVSALSLNPTSVVGGNSSTGTVTLSSAAPAGGAVVTLSSNNSAAQLPASVTVAANATTATFTVTTTSVSSTVSVTITASYNNSSRTATLSVTPRTVSALSLNPTSVVGGTSSTATVTLSSPAPTGGVVVTLSSNNSAAQLPASVTVAANATTATFTVTTTSVSSTVSVTITASYNNSSKTATLSVTTPGLSSLTLNPSTVNRGANSTATVTLNGNAPSGGARVTLSSSNTFIATVPSSVTIPAGSRTATFTVSSNSFFRGTATISGTYSTTQNAVITVQ